MQVAVTGSTGFIGRALVASLRSDGHTVVRVVRGNQTSDTDTAGDVRWDPERGEIAAAGLEGLDAVVHLAGAGVGDRRWSAARKRLILESRTKGTTLLARTLADLARPPRLLLSASGVDYYGSDRGDEILTEDSGTSGEGFLAHVAGAWEEATEPASAAGIRTVLMRNGVVLSRRGGALARMLPPFRLGVGGPMGSGRQWFSWITLADEIGAIHFLLEQDPGQDSLQGPANLTAPEPVTNRALSKALGRTLHRPAILPVPRLGLRLLLGRERADEMLFGSHRVQPQALQQAGYSFRHPDLDTALRSVLHDDDAP